MVYTREVGLAIGKTGEINKRVKVGCISEIQRSLKDREWSPDKNKNRKSGS